MYGVWVIDSNVLVNVPGRRHGNSLQYSYLGNPMERGVYPTTVHGVPKKSDTTE